MLPKNASKIDVHGCLLVSPASSSLHILTRDNKKEFVEDGGFYSKSWFKQHSKIQEGPFDSVK